MPFSIRLLFSPDIPAPDSHATMTLVSFGWGVTTLILLTIIWGSSFAVSKDALDVVSPALLLSLRATFAALSLFWVKPDRRSLKPGIILGILHFLGLAFQVIGLTTTTASKGAFIIALSAVVAPLVSAKFFNQALPGRALVSIFISLAGLALMTLKGEQGFVSGDLWTVGSALFYGLYISYLGEIAHQGSARAMILIQSLTLSILGWLWAMPQLQEFGQLSLTDWAALAYLGVICMSLPAVFQVYAQRVVPTYLTGLIFILEPVFAAIFAFMLLGETMGPLDWLGAAMVMVALLMAGLPERAQKETPLLE